MITLIKGNLLDTDCKIIAHGVNCQNTMGSGVAKALYEKWPEVKERYHQCSNQKLGHTQVVMVSKDKFVINCFTQNLYGYNGVKYVSYDAIYDCFQKLSKIYPEIAIPKIGCGLAGGNWEVVRRIIEDAVEDRCHVKVYYLEDK